MKLFLIPMNFLGGNLSILELQLLINCIYWRQKYCRIFVVAVQVCNVVATCIDTILDTKC